MQANPFFYPDASFERIRSKPGSKPALRDHSPRSRREAGFSCAHCRQYVSCDPELAGVQNRNHCPHCLWSRHMDLNRPGDRLSRCQGRMKPVGLALKNTRQKYGILPGGELMLVHACEACGKISINRAAADDNAYAIWQVFERSLSLSADIAARVSEEGIRMLGAVDQAIVRLRLYGKSEGWDAITPANLQAQP